MLLYPGSLIAGAYLLVLSAIARFTIVEALNKRSRERIATSVCC